MHQDDGIVGYGVEVGLVEGDLRGGLSGEGLEEVEDLSGVASLVEESKREDVAAMAEHYGGVVDKTWKYTPGSDRLFVRLIFTSGRGRHDFLEALNQVGIRLARMAYFSKRLD